MKLSSPLVKSTSSVNITRIPGTACSNPSGGSLRLPAELTATEIARGRMARSANASLVGAAPLNSMATTSASTV